MGVDVNEALLACARANGLETRVGDFSKIPFDDAFFDAVIMTDTIEHVESSLTRHYARDYPRSRTKRSVARHHTSLLGNSPLWNVGEYVGQFMRLSGRLGIYRHSSTNSLEYFLQKIL